MNLQNVANWTIPEGEVMNLRDKDNRLLWSAVGYSTKYEGDTYQKTYTGKNLMPVKNVERTVDGVTFTPNADGSISLSGTANGTGDSVWLITYNGTGTLPRNLPLAAGTYMVSSGGYEYANGVWVQIAHQIPGQSTNYTNSTHSFTKTVDFNFGASIRVKTGTDCTGVVIWPMLEAGDQATSFEPYTAGASPNPDYPQQIDPVTGNQTVTVSDGGLNSQSYTIDLGPIELCKIGTYQDYIWKDGNGWKVHKAMGKTTDAIGSTGITISGMVPNAQVYSYCGGTVSGTTITYVSALTVANTIYYPLATPTDTVITDATLVGQLNAVHQWLTRYGYNATVSGNLPIIIDRTNL